MSKKKKEPWRIIVAIISVMFIVFMWIQNDIVTIYSTMTKEQVIPLVVITVAVSLLKVTAITGGMLLIKWVFGKIKS